MQGIALVGAGLALLATLGIGLVAHELTHAAVLHAFGVAYDIRCVCEFVCDQPNTQRAEECQPGPDEYDPLHTPIVLIGRHIV